MAIPAWLWWLAVPVTATSLSALLFWWIGRPRRRPTLAQSMRSHHRYLATLAERDIDDRAPAAQPR